MRPDPGEQRGATITLEKEDPDAGGSWRRQQRCRGDAFAPDGCGKLRVADEELHAIAARLGSDVPYFFVGGTALGLGRGEEVYPLADLPRWWVVLIFPPFGIATADAYAWLDHQRAPSSAPSEVRYLPDTWLGPDRSRS